MAIETTFTLDAKPFDESLKQTDNKVQQFVNKTDSSIGGISNNTAKGFDSTGKKLQTTFQNMGKGIKLGLGGPLGEVFEKLGGVAGAAGPIAIIAAGIASLIKIVRFFFQEIEDGYNDAIDKAKQFAEQAAGSTSRDKRNTDKNREAILFFSSKQGQELTRSELRKAKEYADHLKKYMEIDGIQIDYESKKFTGFDAKKIASASNANYQREIDNVSTEIKAMKEQVSANADLQKYYANWEKYSKNIIGRVANSKNIALSKEQIALLDKLMASVQRRRELMDAQEKAAGEIGDVVVAAAEAQAGAIDKETEALKKRNAEMAEAERYAKMTTEEKISVEQTKIDAAKKEEQAKREELKKTPQYGWTVEENADLIKRRAQMKNDIESAIQAQMDGEKKLADLRLKQHQELEQKRKEAEQQRKEAVQQRIKELTAESEALKQGMPQFSGEIFTNQLTSRGGFASGGVISDNARYQQQILATNRQSLAKMTAIERKLEELKRI